MYDVTYSSGNIATLWSYSYSLNPGHKSSNPSPKSLDPGPNLGSLRQSVDWGSNPGPKSSKTRPNSSSPGYTKIQFSIWFVWTSGHLEPCQLFGSWMSAVWILESASITVSGILTSSPVLAQTAVVQGMRIRAVPSVSIMDLGAIPAIRFLIPAVKSWCPQVFVS